MAKKKKTEGEPGDSEAKGGGKMMPAAMISLALLGAGYFVGGRGSSSPPTAVAEVATTEPPVAEIIDLEPVNVNLADGHYLRVAISLGMSAGESGAAAEGEGATGLPTAPAADVVLATFSGKTVDELSTLEGRIAAREAIHEGLQEFYGEEIVTVFFTVAR